MKLPAAGGLTIHCLVLGEFQTNCYVLAGQDAAGACCVVDPGLSPQPLLKHLERNRLVPGRILLTHGHGDHIGGIAAVKKAYPDAVITAPAGDAHMLTDALANLSLLFALYVKAPPAEETVSPGDEIQMSGFTWRVLDTAGHTAGGVSYYCPEAGTVLAGDALFAGGIGRTDIPGASERRLLENIRENLLSLPDDTRVLPGHGPTTTIAAERRENPFLR